LEDVSFAAAPELAGAGKLARGHLPLLWLLVPIAAAYTFCFTTDFHSTVVGALLLAAGGGGAVVLAWLRPTRTGLWAVCQCTGAAGVGLLVFTANVAPLVDWEGLPPREAELTLRWRQVFIGKPDAKTVSGIARVVAAPELLPELVGTDIYCQVRKPAPELLTERGTVFTATGVLDTTRRALEQPVFVRKVVNGASDAPALAPSADFDAEGFLRYLENRRATMSLARARLGEVVSPPPRFLLLASRQGKRLESGLRRGLESGSATSEFVAGILPQSWRGAWEARWAETSDLFAGILLGRRVARDTRQIFARTGVTHLFSVSGLHVGVIAAMLFWAGRRLRAPAAAWPAVVIVATFLFVMLTGCSPAAFRAWFMVSCVLAARFASRRGSAGAGLIFAATVVLLWEPLLWLDIGFQLSYGVVGALVFYGSPLTGWVLARWTPFAYVPPKSRSVWQRFLLWLQKWFVASFAVSASATLTSAPLIVAHFGLFSAGSLLANLVIVPLAFPVIALGFLSLALGVFGAGALAVPLNALAGVNLVVLGAIAHFVSALPGVAWEFSYRAAWLGSAAALALAAMFLLLPFGAARRGSGWLFWVPPAFVLLTFLAAK
jgi:competence protein ComEC